MTSTISDGISFSNPYLRPRYRSSSCIQIASKSRKLEISGCMTSILKENNIVNEQHLAPSNFFTPEMLSKASRRNIGVHGVSDSSHFSVEDPGSKKIDNYSAQVIPAVSVACVGAFLFGYHLGVVNGPLEQILIDLAVPGKSVIGGWIVSVTLAGAFFGAFSAGGIADAYGRTRAFQLVTIPLLVGTILSATSSVVVAMIAGRFLVGLGIGLSSSVVPLYISEVAPTNIRGLLGTVNQLAICVGILGALVAGLPLARNPSWWRNMFWLAVIPTVVLFLGMSWAPESPRWLYKQGRSKDAELAARRLFGSSKAESAIAELASSSDDKDGKTEGGWGEMFSPKYLRVTTLGASLYLFQQLAGINAVVYYSSAVFRKVGIRSDVAASALVGLANVIGTGIASGLMDSQGRKKLLELSFCGMASSMFVLALSLSWTALEAFSGILAVTGTVMYVLSFSLGVGPVPALLLPEIFPSRIRAKGVALSLGVHWVTNFLIGLTFLAVVNVVGISWVYFFFASVCVAGAVFVNNFVVETKGRSLEEIESMLIS